MTRPQQPRIDLNHGYFQFIRRNQVDRDEYHKIHEERRTELRERFSEWSEKHEKPPKPANLYIPPHLRRTQPVEASVSARPSASRSDSDTQDEEKPREKSKMDEDRIRHQVRRRIERTHPTIDDICDQLEQYSIRETERIYRMMERDDETSLFTFELTLQNGDTKMISVPRNTQAARLAKSISREHSFDDSQCRNLRLYLEEQLEQRLALERRKRRTNGSTGSSSSASSVSSSSVPTSPCSSSSSVRIPSLLSSS